MAVCGGLISTMFKADLHVGPLVLIADDEAALARFSSFPAAFREKFVLKQFRTENRFTLFLELH
ncbi:hypothetical protein MPL3365_180035 [Mesorhizobium plurifarium]|uniref:Uncharacterized protein n=1 Tax=Mesorhizobium plurifarium TaxID=69974 RepID=A0A090G6J3_MESPL|nr:hypothetical protein MPL3365_180035 [Mesorhizobium plurifarium]